MYIETSKQERLALGIGNYECNWGLHLAGIYETESQRDEILFGFLARGLRDGDLQLYCPVERSEADFRRRFAHQHPAMKAALDDVNQFQFCSARDLYYPDGRFSPKAMERGLAAYFEESQRRGRRNVRACAEMVWALDAIPGREQLFIYESRLNRFIAGKPWCSICLYNIMKFSGEQVMRVLQTHPYTISAAGILENPYYVNPDDWLREHAPEHLAT